MTTSDADCLKFLYFPDILQILTRTGHASRTRSCCCLHVFQHMPTLLQEPILRGNEDGCEMVAKDLCTGFGRRSSNLVFDKGTVDNLCVWFLVLGAGVT
jgi:hypothetical protein